VSDIAVAEPPVDGDEVLGGEYVDGDVEAVEALP
jgi:hypothetical protein